MDGGGLVRENLLTQQHALNLGFGIRGSCPEQLVFFWLRSSPPISIDELMLICPRNLV